MHSSRGLCILIVTAGLIFGAASGWSAQAEGIDPEKRRQELIATAKDMQADTRMRRIALHDLEAEGGRDQPWFRELLLSLLAPQERNPRVAETAVQRLVQGWGPGQDASLKQHLLSVATAPKRWDELRTTAMRALCTVWGRDEEVKQALLHLAVPEEPDEKVRGSVMDTLADVWGAQDWLKDLLLLYASPHEKVPWVRMRAILALGRAWPRESSLKGILLTYATSPMEDWEVRSASIEALGLAWGGQDWLKELLLPLTTPDHKNQDERFFALYALGRFFGPQPWLKDLLLPIAASPQTEEHARRQCTLDIASLWGREEWVRDFLVTQAREPQSGWLVRHAALSALLELWAKEQTADPQNGRDAATVKGKADGELPWLKDLLLQLCAPTEKDGSIRSASLWALCNVWEREPWLKPLLQSLETDEGMRDMAAAQLKRF